MQTVIFEKKSYSSPVVAMVGTLVADTQGHRHHSSKQIGPGDQIILCNPPTCKDSDWFSNCEETSA